MNDKEYIREEKYLTICTQHIREVKYAIQYNKENHNQYLIKDDTNLLGLEGVLELTKNGYEIMPFRSQAGCDGYCIYRHKNYDYDNTKIEYDPKEIKR